AYALAASTQGYRKLCAATGSKAERQFDRHLGRWVLGAPRRRGNSGAHDSTNCLGGRALTRPDLFRDLLRGCAGCEQSAEEKIERSSHCSCLELCDSRLAGAELLGQLELRQMATNATSLEAVAEGELHLDDLRLFLGKTEELIRGSNSPARRFKSLLPGCVHWSSLLPIPAYSASPVALYARSRRLQFSTIADGVARAFLSNTSRTTMASVAMK